MATNKPLGSRPTWMEESLMKGLVRGQSIEKVWIDDAGIPERKVYSIVEIVLKDGKTIEFMAKASPSVTQHLVKAMQDTGYLTLWNDSDTLCIAASEVKHFTMREVSKQE